MNVKLTSELTFRSSIKSEMSTSPTCLAISVRRPGICRARTMWGLLSACCLGDGQVPILETVVPPAEASGDGHQADEGVCVRRTQRFKTGASAAQHAWVSCVWLWRGSQTCGSQCLLSFSDISASESIMKTKTNQDFQELQRIEHCNHWIFTFTLTRLIRRYKCISISLSQLYLKGLKSVNVFLS